MKGCFLSSAQYYLKAKHGGNREAKKSKELEQVLDSPRVNVIQVGE